MHLNLKNRRWVLADPLLMFILMGLGLFAGCGGGGGAETPATALSAAPPTDAPPAYPRSLAINPKGVQLPVGGQQHFSATADAPSTPEIVWSIQEGAAGGTILSDGTYTAPARPGTYHVIATVKDDAEVQAATEVTVISKGSIEVKPATLFLGPGTKQHFSASVTEAADQTVTWGVSEKDGGAISEDGDYTSPAATGTYHVAATGQSDPSLQGKATVTVSPLLPTGIACNVFPRLPYVAWVSSRSAAIAWRCNPNGSVQWGPGQGRNRTLPDNTDQDQHFALLTDLTPGTTYSYSVEIEGERLGPLSTFTTAPAQGSNASFIAFADSGSGSIHQTRVAEVMKRLSFDFALIAGDIVYDKGADADYDPRYFQPYGDLIKRLPFFPAAGNHDIVTESGGPFRSNFYLPQGNFYYDFFWGDIHLIALDSNKVTDPKQRAWLETALQAPARWKIVYFHHPAFSSAEYGDTPAVQSKWVPLFEKYHADLVINGHAHGYERTVPINGVTYIVTGGGGAPLYPVGRNERTAVSSETYELVSVNLTANALILKALDEAGNMIDTVEIDKPIQ